MARKLVMHHEQRIPRILWQTVVSSFRTLHGAAEGKRIRALQPVRGCTQNWSQLQTPHWISPFAFWAHAGLVSEQRKSAETNHARWCDTEEKESSLQWQSLILKNCLRAKLVQKCLQLIHYQVRFQMEPWNCLDQYEILRVVLEIRGSVWVEEKKWVWPTISSTSTEEFFFQQFCINSFSDKYISWASEPLLDLNLTANLGNPPKATMASGSQICTSN